ncbi:hypothetical protein DRC48_24435 [Salmonella enterica]|nr:hypothetical protein [Salmonella enterica subsp. enterica]EBN5685399.1 hypothetical protein [Salmonella enterica]ECC9711308.1 hypothetical protein [Salmonella enterica subsp. enterica]
MGMKRARQSRDKSRDMKCDRVWRTDMFNAYEYNSCLNKILMSQRCLTANSGLIEVLTSSGLPADVFMSMTTASITAGPAAAASVLSQTLPGLSVSAAVATMIHAGAFWTRHTG